MLLAGYTNESMWEGTPAGDYDFAAVLLDNIYATTPAFTPGPTPTPVIPPTPVPKSAGPTDHSTAEPSVREPIVPVASSAPLPTVQITTSRGPHAAIIGAAVAAGVALVAMAMCLVRWIVNQRRATKRSTHAESFERGHDGDGDVTVDCSWPGEVVPSDEGEPPPRHQQPANTANDTSTSKNMSKPDPSPSKGPFKSRRSLLRKQASSTDKKASTKEGYNRGNGVDEDTMDPALSPVAGVSADTKSVLESVGVVDAAASAGCVPAHRESSQMGQPTGAGTIVNRSTVAETASTIGAPAPQNKSQASGADRLPSSRSPSQPEDRNQDGTSPGTWGHQSRGLGIAEAVLEAAAELAKTSAIPGVSDAATVISTLVKLVMEHCGVEGVAEWRMRWCRSILILLERAEKVLGKVRLRYDLGLRTALSPVLGTPVGRCCLFTVHHGHGGRGNWSRRTNHFTFLIPQGWRDFLRHVGITRVTSPFSIDAAARRM